MRHTTGWRLLSVFTWLVVMAGVIYAQDNSHPTVLPNQKPSRSEIFPCKAGTNFESDGYRIAHTTLDDPFKFLYWLNRKTNSVQAQLSKRLDNQPFTYKLADTDGLRLIEEARFVPNSGRGFVVRVELVSVQNCDPKAKTLDLVYRVYSTNPPKVLGGGAESQVIAEKSPQTITGLAQVGHPFHFTPTGGYNHSYNIFGGGRIQITPKFKGFRFFDTLTAEGQGSSSMRHFSAAVSGSETFLGWFRHTDWRFNYQNDSVPTGATRLQKAGLSGQADGETRPFWNGTVLARFGGLLQGGYMQSGTLLPRLLPQQTVSNAGYGSLKAYLGLSSRVSHNVLSVSYGLELGSIRPSTGVDWRKQIGDVNDKFWVSIGDHKPLEVESRFTFGGIQVLHSIPLPALFFGGNGEQFFVPGDSWQIRDVPVIRAIPANQFYLTTQGAGANRFSSINLTMAYPLKSHPIMPKDLSADPEFNSLLQAQIVSATSLEQNYYSWKDSHFGAAWNKLPDLERLLDDLQKVVNTAQASHPGQLEDQFADCTSNIFTANFDATSSRNAKGVAQYGGLSDLLSPNTDDLKSVLDACVVELNQSLGDPGITSAAAAVDAARADMLKDFSAISQKLAAQKAANDIVFVKRTLNTLFKDLNIFSVSPVVVFDRASIGPENGTLGGTRIGPGGGVRFELVSSADFTLGYAWNVNHHAGEGKGALFFSIDVRDLFH